MGLEVSELEPALYKQPNRHMPSTSRRKGSQSHRNREIDRCTRK